MKEMAARTAKKAADEGLFQYDRGASQQGVLPHV